MNHLTYALSAGRSAPANDEGHDAPHVVAPKDHVTQCLNFKQNQDSLQGLADDVSTFARLARQFARIGFNLYPLSGSSVLVTAPHLGMSRALPDLRTARA